MRLAKMKIIWMFLGSLILPFSIANTKNHTQIAVTDNESEKVHNAQVELGMSLIQQGLIKKEFVDEDCAILLQKLTNNMMTNSETVYKIFQNSGKDYNDFGRFQQCEQMPDFNYILLMISPNKELPNSISWGVCVPTVCKDVDLNAYKSFIVNAINNQVPYIFGNVEGLGIKNLQLTIDEI